jgi:hypothetical protein
VRFHEFDRDSNAAYQCALRWCITGDAAYAKVSIGILNAWPESLRTISGADAVLCASLGGYKMANAAELLRHTDSGWTSKDAERFGRMLNDVFLPVIDNFAPFANGNWDTAAMKMMMAIAIYGDDRPLFERALEYYRWGCGDGQLAHYIYPNGQCQESGRDQQHMQLGLAHSGDCCEMAWHQGLDLYATLDSRLLSGFEYTARYNLGEEVPFQPDADQTGKYRHTVISPRGPLRPVYEQIYNHYVHRKGISAPWTQRAAEKLRPEDAAFGADHTGFGTLLYTREAGPDTDEAATFAVPSGLHATEVGGAIQLDFVPLAAATHCTVSRADTKDGPYSSIARNIPGTTYRDHSVKASRVYFYRLNAPGLRQTSLSVPQMKGLPSGWRQENVGQLPGHSSASFDGVTYRLQAASAQPVEQGGPFFFVHHAMPNQGALIARLLPMLASQSVRLGLAVRSETAAAGPEAMLLVTPKGGPTERPLWAASLLRRTQFGEDLHAVGDQPLAAPTVTYGRLVEPLWLRMQRTAGMLHAANLERW